MVSSTPTIHLDSSYVFVQLVFRNGFLVIQTPIYHPSRELCGCGMRRAHRAYDGFVQGRCTVCHGDGCAEARPHLPARG